MGKGGMKSFMDRSRDKLANALAGTFDGENGSAASKQARTALSGPGAAPEVRSENPFDEPQSNFMKYALSKQASCLNDFLSAI